MSMGMNHINMQIMNMERDMDMGMAMNTEMFMDKDTNTIFCGPATVAIWGCERKY
jgi:hypothetical protein